MNDLISRSWLLDVVENAIQWDTERDKNLAIHHVRELTPPAEPQWIPCSKKLPYAEYGESPNVYCYCYDPDLGGKWAQLLYYDGGVWCLPTGETFEYRVLAWYPLPTKPYKEGE